MKRLQNKFASILAGGDIPEEAMLTLPTVSVAGLRHIAIEPQNGLVAYSKESITVAVSYGTVCVSGENLNITLMRNGRMEIRGDIFGIALQREQEP